MPVKSNESNSFELLLDKLIETQVHGANATTGLQSAVQSTNEHLKEVHRILEDINKHFSNGFRKEIKDHITTEIDTIESQLEAHCGQLVEKSHKDKDGYLSILSQIEQLNSTLMKKIDHIMNPWIWVKAFIFIGSLFGMIAAVVTLVSKLLAE